MLTATYHVSAFALGDYTQLQLKGCRSAPIKVWLVFNNADAREYSPNEDRTRILQLLTCEPRSLSAAPCYSAAYLPFHAKVS